mmetsp:Transcript_16444/g.51509  ORF Transcript_16444/g.51509 Transcript_16444/m.51509 type:complete len:224 (+) Transcript_16444:43-714(+)
MEEAAQTAKGEGEAVYTPNPLAPNATVALVEQPTQNWVSEWFCWNNCDCGVDLPLCCYVACCPACAWGEIMEAIETPAPCCTSTSCFSSCSCLYLTEFGQVFLINMLAAHYPMSQHFSGLMNVASLVSMRSRATLGSKYGLDVTDCGGPCCIHYWCFSCALFQEALYVKHVLKKDPSSCCYTCCCKTVCTCGDTPEPGDLATIRNRHQQIALVTTNQPVADVV